jgi:hypothetical protein
MFRLRHSYHRIRGVDVNLYSEPCSKRGSIVNVHVASDDWLMQSAALFV